MSILSINQTVHMQHHSPPSPENRKFSKKKKILDLFDTFLSAAFLSSSLSVYTGSIPKWASSRLLARILPRYERFSRCLMHAAAVIIIIVVVVEEEAVII